MGGLGKWILVATEWLDVERLEDKQYLGKHWNSDKWASYHMGTEAENIQSQFLLVLDEVKKLVGKKDGVGKWRKFTGL